MTFLSSNLIEHSPGLSRKGAVSEVLTWILKWITNSACFWASLWGSSGIWLPHFKSCFTISACGRRSNLCTYFLIYKMKIIVVLYKILWGLNTHEVPKTEEPQRAGHLCGPARVCAAGDQRSWYLHPGWGFWLGWGCGEPGSMWP